jgi:hypothetical protein
MCDAYHVYLVTKRNPVLCTEYKINKNEYDLIPKTPTGRSATLKGSCLAL